MTTQLERNQALIAKANKIIPGLPALEGSEKQIAWALVIRAELIGRVGRITSGVNPNMPIAIKERIEQFMETEVAPPLMAQTSAKWFIDNRAGAERAFEAACRKAEADLNAIRNAIRVASAAS
jgi:hypothetical protein